MIISVEELRQFVTTDETDQALEFRIQALESFICSYTNNNFKNRRTGVVEYPADVKMGVINALKWDIESREKIGVSSETISRHSVTYTAVDGDNTSGGYPKAVIGFLKPYMKARFGQGLCE